MRYLSWDEVKSLDKFLVEDNDDAVGIEIHTGLYDERAEDPYGKPETVKAYTLEELSGGDFLKLGTNLLRAVVCNRLYYTDGRNWVDNTKMNVAYIGARREGGYDYERRMRKFWPWIVLWPGITSGSKPCGLCPVSGAWAAPIPRAFPVTGSEPGIIRWRSWMAGNFCGRKVFPSGL